MNSQQKASGDRVHGRCYAAISYAAISTNLLLDKASDQDLTKQYKRLHQ